MFRPLLSFVLLVVLSLPAAGHELPDGQIDRRVQVSVKPDCVLVEYSLQMSEVTLEQELRRSGRKPTSTLSAKWDQYKELAPASLAKDTLITIDGKTKALKPVRADFSGWSHPRLVCLLKLDVKLTPKPMAIGVVDQNFLKTPGKYRIAMKGRSGATLEKSSVPALLSQAKTIELGKLNAKKRQAVTRAEGVFSLSPKKNRKTVEASLN